MSRRINGMIIIKTEAEIAMMRESATLVSKTLTEVAKSAEARDDYISDR
jgi:Xaa-Pro aminopeptidase